MGHYKSTLIKLLEAYSPERKASPIESMLMSIAASLAELADIAVRWDESRTILLSEAGGEE